MVVTVRASAGIDQDGLQRAESSPPDTEPSRQPPNGPNASTSGGGAPSESVDLRIIPIGQRSIQSSSDPYELERASHATRGGIPLAGAPLQRPCRGFLDANADAVATARRLLRHERARFRQVHRQVERSALQSYGSGLDWIDRCPIAIMRRSTDSLAAPRPFGAYDRDR